MPAHHQSPNPHMSATFYPGNVDAFQMPEVISPAPQRVMPEVPENMQDNLAHLEREAYTPGRIASHMPSYPQDDRSYSDAYGQEAYGQPLQSLSERPNFSPFPVLRNPPPNVPPTDDQREANLESGRIAVLNSSDPEMQLAWAQDALSYVEVAMQNEIRMAAFQPPRPQTPQIERQLKTDAINVVSFLAEQSHPRALFIKAMWLEFGKFGFRVDKKEAFLCYSQASEKGYARAEYRMGMQFENSGEPLKAIKHYERGVSLGDSASNYRLGMMILLGQHGQRQDYAAGLDHIRYAAQTCDENAPQGAYVYGMLLARELPQVVVPDEYLPYDLNAARINIEKAAYHGFAKAQVKMGAAYELCQLGCDFNPALSLHYNALAARQGEPEAEMAISKWFLCGHEGLFEKNDEMAYTYAKRAAQSGLATAEFALGYFHEIGIYVPVNIKEARVWYAKAAARGNKDASSRIESISRSKTLSRKDHERVAIARIKSQYASHGRAQRFAEPQSVQPIQQDTLEMPDPSRMTISSREPRNHRPMSAAPYPEAPNTGYVNPPGQYSPNMRSSSAFGINPNIRPHSVNPGGPMQAHIPPTADQYIHKPKPAGGLPGKGPKTFEEMGVPQGKGDSDCESNYLSDASHASPPVKLRALDLDPVKAIIPLRSVLISNIVLLPALLRHHSFSSH
ncbi:chitin synthase activator [Histoplasma capsulatum H143]|uniref:Chitin synthase activator n=1 Tax=Ajellomyces capsulatus (strain H143) TaxID=544712 RepID=C6H905_AJECH|nr:chitin synthase activator [Histoplasma capsulatum H143]